MPADGLNVETPLGHHKDISVTLSQFESLFLPLDYECFASYEPQQVSGYFFIIDLAKHLTMSQCLTLGVLMLTVLKAFFCPSWGRQFLKLSRNCTTDKIIWKKKKNYSMEKFLKVSLWKPWIHVYYLAPRNNLYNPLEIIYITLAELSAYY